jgi:tetratricopeptide (TPR) repeat protein
VAVDTSGPYAFNLGNAYFGAKAYDLATQQYNYAIDHGSPAYYDRGKAWFEKQNYERAIADFAQAIRAEPNNCFIYIRRADAYAHKGDRDNAIADYCSALALASTEGDDAGKQIDAALERLGAEATGQIDDGAAHKAKHRKRVIRRSGVPWLR